ncbi:hypothetical protein EV699_11298 [Plasticicumulans lactativorans]|uniref:Tetratricopeptide repeat protein n=1 Tax=Plasticicumulans lactativorans TaxID=1133106 RepID=A0A4R2L4S2_9GAMM|nr:hypothetical protein [Plasticicumulans lactativorans]TCO80762.1 hypothetical protein EV699_11298 [Plasticicumulans lactativorans]
MPRSAWLLLPLLLTVAVPNPAVGQSNLSEWVKLAEHARDLEHLQQANARLSGDVDALGTQVRELQLKLAEATKDAAALKDKVDWQDKRVADLSTYAGLLGAMIALLALIAAFAGFVSVKSLARRTAEDWLSQEAAKLRLQLAALEQQAEALRQRQADAHVDLDKTQQEVEEHRRALIRSVTEFSRLTAEQRDAVLQQAAAARAKPETAYTATDWIARASKAIAEGKLEVARELLDEALAAEGHADADRAQMMVMRGYVLGELGQGQDAIAVYDEIDHRFGAHSEPALLEHAAKAIVNKGIMLGRLGRPQEEIAVYEEADRRFAAHGDPAVLQQLAKALVNKGVTLNEVGRSQEEIAAYEEVERRFGARSEATLLAQVAKALVNKAITLGELGKPQEEIAVYDEVLERFGTRSEAVLLEEVARAFVNKGITLGQLDRPQEEIALYDEVLSRFGARGEAALLEQVARALVSKGSRLGRLDRLQEAIAVYDEVLGRFGAREEKPLQALVERARTSRAELLDAKD